MNKDSQNINELPQDVLDLIAYGFSNHFLLWDLVYMYEIKLDDPFRNLTEGGPGLVCHAGNGSRCYASHYNDKEWAVIHFEDNAWNKLDIEQMAIRGAKKTNDQRKNKKTN